ncbi:MAG: DUF1622 domain-containing protein [Coriobacteriia bacterium]|nr:DUF1622 domain-containing protein [Coriobacteriia bacterium]
MLLGTAEVMGTVSIAFEWVGVACILGGFVLAVSSAGRLALAGRREDAYTSMRSLFGRAVLLGLEILVAADLIRTVAVQPTLQNLTVLGMLVVIRTFLSWSLDVELEGVWPWRKRELGLCEDAPKLSAR